jgi:hypothetical protein
VAGPLTPELNDRLAGDRLNLTAVPADLTLGGNVVSFAATFNRP